MGNSNQSVDRSFEAENRLAVDEAREADRVEPRARAATYDRERDLVLVELRSGYVFGIPPGRVPGLSSADAEERSDIRISPSGDGLRWDRLDVDASLTGLILGGLNLRAWAPRIMGQVRSESKARAARENGLKGGRPKGTGKAKRKGR